MQEKKESIKIALLGLIAVTLLVNTYMMTQKKSAISGAMDRPLASSTAVANPGTTDPMSPVANTANPNLSTSRNTDPTSAITPPSNQKTTRMAFSNYQHDFGKVKQESTNKYSFQFTNTGDEPLVITNAVGSCGCTVPNYPKEPVMPGKTASIDVEYKPGQQKGSQEKKVTITANTEPAETILTIKADVQEIQ